MIWFDMKWAISHTHKADNYLTQRRTKRWSPINSNRLEEPKFLNQVISLPMAIFFYFYFLSGLKIHNEKDHALCPTFWNSTFLFSGIQNIFIEKIWKFVNIIWWVETTDALLLTLIFKIIIKNFWRILQKIRCCVLCKLASNSFYNMLELESLRRLYKRKK